MGRVASPYVKVVAKDGIWEVSVHKSVIGGHIAVKKGTVTYGDSVALQAEVERLLTEARQPTIS